MHKKKQFSLRRLVAFIAALAMLSGLAASTSKLPRAYADPRETNSDGFTINPNQGSTAGGNTVAITPASKPSGGGTVSPQGYRVSGGVEHSLLLTNDGKVMSWGSNARGQLGRSAFGKDPTPRTVSLPSSAAQVSGGGYHSLALLANGQVYSWGSNAEGQLGRGGNTSTPGQVALPAGVRIVSIGAGSNYSAALDSTGSLWTWGANDYGQLGLGSTYSSSSSSTFCLRPAPKPVPKPCPKPKPWPILWPKPCPKPPAPTPNPCPKPPAPTPAPTPVPSTPQQVPGVKFKDFSAGNWHVLAHGVDGLVYAWGRNDSGQLGIRNYVNAYSPVVAAYTFPFLSAGGSFSAALDSSGHAWTWGSNSYGQLGSAGSKSSLQNRAYPDTISSTYGDLVFSSVSAGTDYALAVKAGSLGGQLYAWGANGSGQSLLGQVKTWFGCQPSPTWTDNPQPSVGSNGRSFAYAVALTNHSLGVDSAGTVLSWGCNTCGQLGIGNCCETCTLQCVICVPKVSTSTGSGGGSNGPARPYEITMVFFGGQQINPSQAVSIDSSTGTWTVRAPAHSVAEQVDVLVLYLDASGSQLVTTLHYSYQGPAASNVTVTFDRGRAPTSVAMPSTRTIPRGTVTTAPPDPQWDKHEFVAWYYNGSAWDFSQPVNASMTLVAQWKDKEPPVPQYTVKFNLGGAPGTPPGDQIVTENSPATEPPQQPSWDRHNFKGWYKDPDTKPWDFSTGVTENMTLTAHWAKTYTVTFKPGDAPASVKMPDPQIVETGKLVREPVAPVWTGFAVDKWVVKGSAKDKEWNFATDTVTEDVTLVAVWVATSYFTPSTTHGPASGGTRITLTPSAGMRSNTPLSFSKASQASAAGSYHNLAIGSDGNTYAWGSNSVGQLGDGTTESKTKPIKVDAPVGVKFVKVFAGAYSSFGITVDGSLYAWGYNNMGNLGIGKTGFYQTKPVKVSAPAGLSFTQVSADMDSTLALTSDGQVYSSGYNYYGQLGLGSTLNVNSFQRANLPAGVRVRQVVAGKSCFGLALTTGGQVYSWGFNDLGQLGLGDQSLRTNPTLVNTPGLVFSQIASASNASYALSSSGQVYSWGYNGYGQLGTGSNTSSSLPQAVTLPAGSAPVQTLAAGIKHMMVIDSNRQVYGWGSNEDWQLGLSSTANQPRPIRLASLAGSWQLLGGYDYTLAIDQEGKAQGFGRNTYGQLGNGSKVDSWQLVQTLPPTPPANSRVTITDVTFAGQDIYVYSNEIDEGWFIYSPPYQAYMKDTSIVIHWTLDGVKQPDCVLPFTYDK